MYSLHFHTPGGIAKTHHADLDGVLRMLDLRDCKLDPFGLACINPNGRRIAVAIFRDNEELPPVIVARLWYGEFSAVESELAA